MTVYDFAKKCMADSEFNAGGIPLNERKWIDSVGFEYTVRDGQVYSYGEDLGKFFSAMVTLCELNKKYNKPQT